MIAALPAPVQQQVVAEAGYDPAKARP